MDAWLSSARDTLARAAGLSPPELVLDMAEVETLLDLARIAAHDSGDRRNAPLLCYLIGRAQRALGLDELAAHVRAVRP
jgi:hypothetical protein